MKKLGIVVAVIIAFMLIAVASGTALTGGSISFILGGWPENVEIDIAPDDPSNTINLETDEVISVVVYGSSSLDVMKIDPGSVRFAGASIPVESVNYGGSPVTMLIAVPVEQYDQSIRVLADCVAAS